MSSHSALHVVRANHGSQLSLTLKVFAFCHVPFYIWAPNPGTTPNNIFGAVIKFGYTSVVYPIKLLSTEGGRERLFQETIQFTTNLSTLWKKGYHVALNNGDSCTLKMGLTATAYFTGSSNWKVIKSNDFLIDSELETKRWKTPLFPNSNLMSHST